MIGAFADTDDDGSQDAGEPVDEATKTWVLPASTRGLQGHQWRPDHRGQRRQGQLRRQRPGQERRSKGNETYQDHGPATAAEGQVDRGPGRHLQQRADAGEHLRHRHGRTAKARSTSASTSPTTASREATTPTGSASATATTRASSRSRAGTSRSTEGCGLQGVARQKRAARALLSVMAPLRIALLAALTALLFAAPARTPPRRAPSPAPSGSAPRRPRPAWTRAKLQDAIDYGIDAGVVRDPRLPPRLPGRRGPAGRQQPHPRYESWSMAKSVTVDDLRARDDARPDLARRPGRLARPRGGRGRTARSRVRDLLTMTSGLQWNGLRDYNIFTMPDRVHDALTLEVVQPPGTYFEYAQSAGRAAGRGGRARDRRGPPGVRPARADRRRSASRRAPGTGRATRPATSRASSACRCARRLRPARRADAPRRRLEGPAPAVARSTCAGRSTPSTTNGCYGWLIWVNAARAVHRPDGHRAPGREQPRLPRPARRHLQLLRPVRPARDGVPDAGHRHRAHRPGPGPRARPAAELGGRALQARARRDHRPDVRAAGRRAARERGDEPRTPTTASRRALRARPVLEGRAAGPAAARRPGARPRRDLRRAARRTRPARRRAREARLSAAVACRRPLGMHGHGEADGREARRLLDRAGRDEDSSASGYPAGRSASSAAWARSCSRRPRGTPTRPAAPSRARRSRVQA